MNRTAWGIMALLFISSCSADQQGSDRSRRAAAAKALAPVNWSTSHVWASGCIEDSCGLSFAVPETDDQPIQFECSRGSQRMKVMAIDPSRSGETLVLVSGNVEGRYPGRRIYDREIDDGIYSSATISASEMVLAEFRRTHVIATGEPSITFPARTLGEREAIQKFFAYCDEAGAATGK